MQTAQPCKPISPTLYSAVDFRDALDIARKPLAISCHVKRGQRMKPITLTCTMSILVGS